MKKIIFAAAVLVYSLLITIAGKAQDIEVPQPVKESFDKHFKNAEYKRWVQVKDEYVATFKEDQNWRDAYFTKDGEYKGIGKYITIDVLPLFVQQTLGNYSNFEISDLYQYECMQNGISYFAVLKNNKHQLIMQLNPYGEITFTQRNKIRENKVSMSSMATSKK